MKKLFMLVFIASTLVNCHQNDEVTPQKGSVSFAPEHVGIGNGREKEIPTPAVVLLSVKDSQGHEQKDLKLSLTAFGQGFNSEDLQLAAGDYQLTKFLVLDNDNKTIYGTPLEGSALADYIDDPLPMDFTVAAGETRQVVPQVVAVPNTATPEMFGYASFSFDIVDITAVRIPITSASTAELTRITYQFTRGAETITAETDPYTFALDLHSPALLGKTWEAVIFAWAVEENCVQKVYRFKGSLTFNGSLLILPAIEQWGAFYYHHVDSYEFLRSADPRDSYHVEVLSPNAPSTYRAVVDRDYFTQEGDEPCNMMIKDSGGTSIIELDDTVCPLAEQDPIYYVASYISLIDSQHPSTNPIVLYFSWKIENNIATPDMCP